MTMAKNVRFGVVVLALLSTLGLGGTLTAEPDGHDWPQFRGVHRDGTSPETGLLGEWPDGGPKEVWRQPIGEGFSAISVVGDRLYTMYAAESETGAREYAAAFDAATGKELWRVDVGEKHDTEFGNGPRSTPTIDGDTAYVLSAKGGFFALGTADGAVKYSFELTERFGSEVPHWGFSTSALIDGKKLILETGGKDGKTYAALDKTTGETIWTLGDEGPGYNSPLASENEAGERRYLYVSGDKLRCIDADGKVVWDHPWPQGETHAMPIVVSPGKIYASGAQGVGAQLVEVQADESGVAELWRSNGMKNHFSSALLHGEHVYGFDNATLKAIAVSDASMAWGKRGLGKGSLILADGHLIVLSDRGKLLLVAASPEGYQEMGSVQALQGRSWTAPVIANGRLYLRNHTEMVVYDLAG